MKKIKEICSNIHEVICYIKRETIFDYFTKFDLDKKGYFYLDQLECILIDDLGIYNNELINLFLSYILCDTKIDDLYIIAFDKLIEIITKFIEIKNDEETNILKNTFFYTDEISNKLLGSTIMNIRLNKRQESTYAFSPGSGIF